MKSKTESPAENGGSWMRPIWVILVALAAAITGAVASGWAARAALAIEILDDLRRAGPTSLLERATRPPRMTPLTLAAGGRSFAADLYRPAAGGSRVPVVLVPGLVEAGKDDPRVAPFARLLARAGFTVVVPDLPSFRTIAVRPANLLELGLAVDALAARADLAPDGRAGLFGVSYAGGIAVLSALDPGRAARVPYVAVAGSYADLDSALRFLATGRIFEHGHLRRVPPDAYGQLVFLRTFEDFLPRPGDRATLEAMAARRIAGPAAPIADLAPSLGPEARVIYDLFEGGDPERVPELIARLPPELRARMAALSPARRSLDALRARLYIVHARDDGTFPVTDAYRLADLARRRTRVRLVVLEALQHVEPRPWRRDLWGLVSRDLPEGARLAAWWVALLGER